MPSGSSRLFEYLALARRVERQTGVSMARQALEMLRLGRGPGRIGPGDYFTYGLFDPTLDDQEKRRFAGWKKEPELDALNRESWHCLGLDKVLMYGLLGSAGLRTPETRAIYLPGRRRSLPGAEALTTEAELLRWLRDPAHYPFFSKPSASGFARGAVFAEALGAGDRMSLRDGTTIGVPEFAEGIRDIERLGYLFQQPVPPDPRLVPSIGPMPTSLRMMVLMDDRHGPTLHRCFWKIPTGRNTHDNYNGGRTGNLAAAIDQATGRVTRVINGVGLDVVDVETHPDTRAKLVGLHLPDWQRVIEFTFDACAVFPKLGFQQWDIALADGGPLALEVNLYGTGGCDLTQLLYRRGLLDEQMNEYLSRSRST